MAPALLPLIYLAFVSLGLPDALLGGGWPVMQAEFGTPYGLAGLASLLISAGTVISSLLSTRVLGRFGTGRVTAASVSLTALALIGFGLAPGFGWILLVALPLGVGAGAVDAGLNAYVARHYAARHMSWLHACWGLGALGGPLLLSILLGQGAGWRAGYLSIGGFQFLLAGILAMAIPLWAANRGPEASAGATATHRPLFFPLKVPGVPTALAIFFVYCGIEAGLGLWGGSWLVSAKGFAPAAAAAWVSAYYGGICAGRLAAGFLTMRMSDTALIRAGTLCVAAGAAWLAAPVPPAWAPAGFILIGLGCAPIFPSMLHLTPRRWGSADAQAIMGFQMAAAYTGLTLLPPAFGWLASRMGLGLLPGCLAVGAVLLFLGTERLARRTVNPPSPSV